MSTSPQQLLDRTPGLELLVADTSREVRSFTTASAAAARVRDDANGTIVHASDYGVPVKVAPIGNRPINYARRL